MDGFTTRCLQTAGAWFYVIAFITLVVILVYELVAIHNEKEMNKEE